MRLVVLLSVVVEFFFVDLEFVIFGVSLFDGLLVDFLDGLGLPSAVCAYSSAVSHLYNDK